MTRALLTTSPDHLGNVRGGALPTTAEALARALPGIFAVVHPHAIVVFGSRARGDNAPDTDLDLLIAREQPAADPWRVAADIRRAIGAIGTGVDILVSDPQRWEHHRHLAGSIEGMAAREGRMVHLDAA